jgi:hypothetical protein
LSGFEPDFSFANLICSFFNVATFSHSLLLTLLGQPAAAVAAKAEAEARNYAWQRQHDLFF